MEGEWQRFRVLLRERNQGRPFPRKSVINLYSVRLAFFDLIFDI